MTVITKPVDENAPWVEKFRPKSLEDISSHGEIISTIKRLTSMDRLPHLLLHGPPGTGKTSTILAVARQIYGEKAFKSMILELNASDDRNISVVREQIQDFASTRKIFSKGFKLIILDEADAMSKDAQFALRRVIEKYTKNTRFCLICNQVNKIIPALQSRCTRFRFPPLDSSVVKERIKKICDMEQVNIDEGGLDAVVKLSTGDMRKALNILQASSMSSSKVNSDAVYLCTGNPTPKDIELIASWLLNETFVQAVELISKLRKSKGISMTDISRELLLFLFTIDLPTKTRATLVDEISNIEYRLSVGASENLQVGALVGVFTIARKDIVKTAR